MDSLNIGINTVIAQVSSLGKGFMLTGDEAREITSEITMLNAELPKFKPEKISRFSAQGKPHNHTQSTQSSTIKHNRTIKIKM